MVRVGRAPDPGRPTVRQEAPPPGHPRGTTTARKASSQETRAVGLVTGPHAHTPPTGSAQPQARLGETGPGRLPPASKPNGARDRGGTRGGARTAWNGPTGAQHRDRARCARHTNLGRGGGADAARAQAHTRTKDTRGKPEGQPDRARGTHRPRGMAYQRARIREAQTGRPATHSAGNAGREGGNKEDTTHGTDLNPPKLASCAAHTRPGHCTRQGSSGALHHAPAPRLGSLRASPRGYH